VIVHRVVLGQDPLVLHTQDVRKVGAASRHKGGARLLGQNLKLCGEAGKELLAKRSIGRGHLGEACESQFFGEPILERPEHALEAGGAILVAHHGLRGRFLRSRRVARVTCPAPWSFCLVQL
jgi:hypothetical protein